ncbi:60S ribosomal protein L7a-1 [Sesamum alatum]|uniref:60S ribosomal protein L7a-1 n=1 Tax=Sesamum alatum TaxID=300844 RepID=A0AAE1XUV4_9LAMI|nr:60S ribosomal protein L7a-1 [Sesamum alatum]
MNQNPHSVPAQRKENGSKEGRKAAGCSQEVEKVVNPLFEKSPKQFGLGEENGDPILYCQRGKLRLGTIVHKKTASVLCLTSVKNEDKLEFSKILEAIKANFNDKYDETSEEVG